MDEKNIEFGKRLATQTLINFDTLIINGIKRRLKEIIEVLDERN